MPFRFFQLDITTSFCSSAVRPLQLCACVCVDLLCVTRVLYVTFGAVQMYIRVVAVKLVARFVLSVRDGNRKYASVCAS